MNSFTTLAVPAELEAIAAKLRRAERLTFDDGRLLFATRHIHAVGALADIVRRRINADRAWYNVNRHINYTNYCVLRCKFCSFYRPYPKNGAPPQTASAARDGNGRATATLSAIGAANAESARTIPLALAGGSHTGLPSGGGPNEQPLEPDTYELSIEEITRLATEAAERGATEVHIVGGLHPTLPFDYYLDLCRSIRAACPQIHIKAFTAIEIIHFTRISKPRLTIRQVLEQLRHAGLDSLPGGGAEIFDDRVHDEAYRNKVGEQGWFDVHRTAHEMGMFTNATMLYGHLEGPDERLRHLIKLREHQDESLRSRAAAFNCCIPLSFIPEGSELADMPGPTGLDDLRTLAITRLMLDNVPHIKAFWIMQSAKLAQVALSWGCDDLDGTVMWYDITKREGGAGNRRQELTVERMHALIREAGFAPVERDSLYRPVQRDGVAWRVLDGRASSTRAAAST